MTDTITRFDEEEQARRKAALLAMNWIISLAQLDYRNTLSLGDEDFTVYESAALLRGEKNRADIEADRALMRTDFRAFLLRDIETNKTPDDNAAGLRARNLPSVLNPTLREQLEQDIKEEAQAAEHRSGDLFFSELRLDHMGYKNYEYETPEQEHARKQEEEKKIAAILKAQEEKARAFGWADLSCAGRVLWAAEARQHHEDGNFYIKTADGTTLPAWERQHIEKDGIVLVDRVIDNKPLSADQTFYNARGNLFYYDAKQHDLHEIGPRLFQTQLDEENGIKKKRTPLFNKGTPKFDDITDDRLFASINAYMTEKAGDRPVLAVTLAANAASVFNRMAIPTITDFDLKMSYRGNHEKMDAFVRDAHDMVVRARNGQNPSPDAPTTS